MRDLTLDKRYVYGQCTWHDTIHNCGNTGPQKLIVNGREITSHGLPCCPFCGSMLMEVESEKVWQQGVDAHDRVYPGYTALMAWSKGKCFRDFNALLIQYNKEHNTNHTKATYGFREG